MAVEAKASNYWIASNAIYIKLNAMGEGNYIQGNVAANSYILCYMPGIDGLGFDSGHNYRRWQLILYPSIFPDNFKKYVYVAIPRTSKEENNMAMVVFPSVKVDIYGVALESLEDLGIEVGQQVGSEEYYYIYLQGIISENMPSDNGYQREWVDGYEVNTGTLASDESLFIGGDGSWWQYNAVSDSVTFLKKVLTATFGTITATTLDIKSILFGGKTILGVATAESSEQSETDIVTPAYLEMFGVKHFLAKDKDDEASGIITFLEGIKIGARKIYGIAKDGAAHLFSLATEGNSQLGKNGTFTSFGDFHSDSTGARISVGEDGTSTAEFDYINIRRAAQFREITIKELRHIGGELAISAAAMVCSKVERLDASGNVIEDGEAKAFRCYFDTSAGDGAAQKVFQQFKVGDQARCQQFGLDGTTEETAKCTRYYWRLVTEVGADYIVLSDVDKDPLSTVEPQAGDNIVQLGYRYEGDTSRQSAIILSATSGDAPSAKYYQGINDYSLNHLVKDEGYENGAFHSNVYGNSYTGDKDGNSYFSYDAAKKTATFKGKAVFTHGTELPDGTAIEDVTTKKDLENFNIRSGNLLRNTAFSGDYESRDVSGDMEVSDETETFSEKLKYWSTDAATVISADDSSMSGKAATIGLLSQRLDKPLLDGEPYTLSFVGKGTAIVIGIGESLELNQVLTAESKRYELHFINNGRSDVVTFASDNATISDIMLSYGTIAPAWSPAYVDNDKSMAQFQSVKHLLDAISNGSTTIDGGVVMSQMLKVGNFRDKQMVQETGGMSGYYNDDNSPYLWGGGSYEQAIRTIQKYKDNPTYQPTQEELKDMANFVVTHGGRAILNDIILRGIIYAEGGVMKSVKSPNGNFEIDEKGNAKLNGEINSTSGSIGGFELGSNRIGSKQNFDDKGNLQNSSANQMSLYLSELIFNSKDRQAIIGCCTHYIDFLLRLTDVKKDTMPRYGGIVGVQGSADENVAMEYIGGWLSGVNFKNTICGFHHYAYSTDQQTMPTYKDYEIDRTVNCVYATTKCYWKAKDAKEESDANQRVNIKLPELKWYDDGHEILIKRGTCNDNKVNIQARRFCNLEVKHSDYGQPSYEEVWYDTILLTERGTYVTEKELASEMDSICLRFFKDLSVTTTNDDGTKKNYRGVWVEFKHPRDW